MTLYQDTFNRGDTTASTAIFGGWGSASDGESYSSAGAVYTWQILSKEGTATGGTGQAYALLGTNTMDNTDVFVRFEVTNSGDTTGIVLCYTDVNNYYRCRVSGTQVLFDKVSGGTVTNLATASVTRVVSTFYKLRARIDNGVVYAKFWQGNPEPSAWSATGTDSAPLAAGQFGLFVNLNATSHVASFDSFIAQAPAITLPMRVLIATKKTIGMGLRLLILTPKSISLPMRVPIKTQVTPSLPMKALIRTQKTLSMAVRTLVRTQKTVSMPVRAPVKVQVSTSLGMRILIVTQITHRFTSSLAMRIFIRTQATKSLKVRMPIRTQNNTSFLKMRTPIRTKPTKSLTMRILVKPRLVVTLPMRILITRQPIVSVPFPAVARRTGQFPPTSRRTGQFPAAKRRITE